MSKVLFLCNIELANARRGTPIHVARLLRELRRDHDLLVCAASVPPELMDVFIPYPNERGWRKLRAILAIIDGHKPQTVFTIGQVGLVAPVILKILRRVRIVVELQGMEFIEKYGMGHITLFQMYLWKFKSTLLLPFFDVVIAFSLTAARVLPFLRKIAIVYPAIDVDSVPQAKSTQILPLVVGYAGNTDAYQGLMHIFEAVALLRNKGLDVRLSLVLTGNDSSVRNTIQELNLTEFTSIKSNVTQNEAQQEMRMVSVLPIPRKNSPESVYGFPSKLPECLALGVPVILTNIGAVSELMPEIGEYSIVIPPEDITNKLAEALLKVASMSIEERSAFGDRARKYADKFSWKNVTSVVSDVL